MCDDDRAQFLPLTSPSGLTPCGPDLDVRHAAQVWVYEDAGDDGAPNLYVHHDIMLPAFPLALAWLDCHPGRAGEAGNLAAVRPAASDGAPMVTARSQARPAWTQQTRVLNRMQPSLPSTSGWCA